MEIDKKHYRDVIVILNSVMLNERWTSCYSYSIYTLHGNRNNALVRFINVGLKMRMILMKFEKWNAISILLHTRKSRISLKVNVLAQTKCRQRLFAVISAWKKCKLTPAFWDCKIIFGSLSDNLCEGRGLQMLLFDLRVHFHQSVVCKSLRSQPIQHGSHVAQGQCLHQVQRLTSPWYCSRILSPNFRWNWQWDSPWWVQEIIRNDGQI